MKSKVRKEFVELLIPELCAFRPGTFHSSTLPLKSEDLG